MSIIFMFTAHCARMSHTCINEYIMVLQFSSQICGDGESEIEIVPKTASSAGEGDVGGHRKRLQIVSTSSNDSVSSQKTIRIIRTDSASNMNIVTPFGIMIRDNQQQTEAEQPQHFQVVEAMEVTIPKNMIKIAPSLHGLKFEEVPHDKGDIKLTEALFHNTLLVEQPSGMGDIKINNSNTIFRQPSKLEINPNEKGDTKVPKALFRKPSKHVCLSETSIYCYQKSDTEEEVESSQVEVKKTSSTAEKAKENAGINNKNNQTPACQSQSRHVCTSETSIYCYGVSESENEGEFTNSLLKDEENETNEAEEVKRVTFASPSETNIYAYQDYDEEDEEGEEQGAEDDEGDCQQIEVNNNNESQEAKEETKNENRSEEFKEDHHQEGGQMSEKESGTEGEESVQEEEPNKSQDRPRKSKKIRVRKVQNEVLEQIKQILEENNKVNEKKVYNNALVQTNEGSQQTQRDQEQKIFNDALVQNKDIVPDSHPFKEEKVSLLPRPSPVSIMKTSRGNNSSKTSIQFSLPHQVASFSSHDILNQAKEIPQESYRINEQTTYNVGLVQTDEIPLKKFNISEQQNAETRQIKEKETYDEKMQIQGSPKIEAKIRNEFGQQMNEISGRNKSYNFEALEQAKEIRGFTPPQKRVQERMKEEAPIPVKTTISAVDKEKSPPNTTSEVQMQLNNDLKTLESIVKKLYKSLNKKGPLTLVANFKPKQDGELALDMSSLTGRQKKEVSFSSGLSGDGNQPNKTNEKSSKLKVEENKRDRTEEITKEPVKQETKRNVSEKFVSTVSPQVDYGNGPLKPASPPTALPRQNPVSIMKTCHVVNSSKSSHQASNAQAASSSSRKPYVTVSLRDDGSSCSMRSNGSKTNMDVNNNLEMQTPPPSPKSAIKKTPSKMPLLRPASSSHSMLKTCIEPETPSSVGKNKKEDGATPMRPKTSRSKHYFIQAPVSEHAIVEHPKSPSNTYKLVEGSNSKHYLVPVASKQEQPKQVIVTASRSRSGTNTRSQSQHVLMPVPRMNQSQHLISQPSPSKSILRESSTRSKSRHLASAISPSGSHSQHVMMESPKYSKYIINEQPRPKTVRHVFVHPPPTCQNPHLHPRTATLLSPPSSQQAHSRTCTAPAYATRYGGYRIIQPCSMHQNHPQQLSRGPSNHTVQDYSTAEETASNTSIISSISNRTENNRSAPSDAEEGENFHFPSQSQPSRHNWHQQQQQSRSLAPSISPSVRVHIQNPEQSPSKTLTSSPSSTVQPYRTTIRIPPGPPKPRSTYREFEDILSPTSDADTTTEDHVELRNVPSRSRPSCHNWQQHDQQSHPPGPSNSSNPPSVRVHVQNTSRSSLKTVTPSASATKQQYRTTIRIPSKHSKLGSSEVEDNLSAPSDTDNMAQERVVPSRSRSSVHIWQQQNQHATSISPSIKVQDRNEPRSSSKTPSISSTKEQYRTTLHIPSGPPKPSSYSAIFREKQQKQKQTVYVDLTSKGNRRSNR